MRIGLFRFVDISRGECRILGPYETRAAREIRTQYTFQYTSIICYISAKSNPQTSENLEKA